MDVNFLPIATAPVLSKLCAVSGSHTIRGGGLRLDNASKPSVTHSNHATNTVVGNGQGDKSASLGSMESSTDVPKDLRRGTGRSVNCSNGTGMEPPGPIVGNGPQVSNWRSYDIFIRCNIFYYFTGIYDIANRRLLWHDKTFSETEARKSVKKILGAKNLKFCFKRVPPT